MSSTGVVKYDKFLTDFSISFPVGNLIGEIVAPIKKVDMTADKIFTDEDDAINQVNDNAENVPSNGINFAVGTAYSYKTLRHAMHTTLTNKQMQNAESVVQLKQREVAKMTHRLRLKHELAVATILTDTSKVTDYATLSGTARWDSTAPDLETTIITACKTIQANVGVVPNTIVIPFAAALYAAKMSFIRDTLKYEGGQGTRNLILELLGMPPVIKGLRTVISTGRKNANAKGQTKSVSDPWGANVLIGYVPPNPGIDSMAGILTMEYDSRKVHEEQLTDPYGVKVVTEWDYDIAELNLDCWYLVQTVIS